MKNKLYEGGDILAAKRAMLDHLASLSGGELIRGCCTQGCCDLDHDDFRIMPTLAHTYSRADLLNAKRAMLEKLAQISGGELVRGCCTQGCCDNDGIAAFINVP